MSNKAKSKKGIQPKLRFPEFRDAGDWAEKPLFDIIETVTPPKKIQTAQYYKSGLFPIIDQSQNQIAGWTNDRGAVINEGLPLIVFGDHTCILKIVDEPFAQGADGIKIFHGSSEVATDYLHQYLQSNPLKMEEYKRHFSILKDKVVFYPKRESGEQLKIAECLSSLDELIEAEDQKLDALQRYKKGLMQELFPAKGETQPRLRFPEFQDAGEWKEEPFGKVLKINSGKGFKALEYSKTGIRLLQIENVGYGVTKWNENTIYLPETYATEYPELVLRGGDIVLALNRPVTNDQLKMAKIPKHEAIAILYQRVGKIEVLNGSLRVDFAFQLCRQFIKDFVINKSIGSDQPFISLKDLYAQNVLLPSPAEQQRIADALSSLDDLITAQSQKLDSLRDHKKGLMRQLFPAPSNESEG